MSLPRYPKYKNSGVEWLGEVPNHWEVLSIKRLSPVQRGASPRPIDDPKYFDDEGEYAWVRIADVSASNGVLTETTQRLSERGSNLSVKLSPGELFVSIAGTVGKPCISAIKACIHDGFVYFPNLKIPPHFLFRIFEAGLCYSGLGKWGTQLNLNTDTIGSIKIALPPADELTLVLDFINREAGKIDALIAGQEKLLTLLVEKRQATISHAVTRGLDPDAPVKDCGIAWLGKVPPHWEVVGLTKYLESVVDYRGRTPTKVDDGVFLVTAKNIRNGVIDYEASQEYIDRAEYDEVMRRGLPLKGDVLFTTEAPLGQVAIVDREDIALAQRIIKFRTVPERLESSYLKTWIMGSFCQFNLEQLATGSTALGIKGSKVGQVRLCLPPLDEQRAIVRHINAETRKLDTLKSEVEHAIELLKERRSALIAAAVTGKIDVRNAVQQELAA
ncbi:restriction endonuclease subunit S [Burkholderia diffusa]|uniref:restriction endonuclease subunit S n=1 Tax=Burkholderia diffusa TaxID=488732 RepID=UPI00264D47FB|nr:restriction endonuclease subunit S [Burkholderia diffusa]MDN7908313.1 restriction endonuclease subunit S [Burkholderia diffusa]